ncbi:hypothetical protein Tco_0047951, partial [Tanacetum coccineum]
AGVAKDGVTVEDSVGTCDGTVIGTEESILMDDEGSVT